MNGIETMERSDSIIEQRSRSGSCWNVQKWYEWAIIVCIETVQKRKQIIEMLCFWKQKTIKAKNKRHTNLLLMIYQIIFTLRKIFFLRIIDYLTEIVLNTDSSAVSNNQKDKQHTHNQNQDTR